MNRELHTTADEVLWFRYCIKGLVKHRVQKSVRQGSAGTKYCPKIHMPGDKMYMHEPTRNEPMFSGHDMEARILDWKGLLIMVSIN